jgi:hypothetical protein
LRQEPYGAAAKGLGRWLEKSIDTRQEQAHMCGLLLMLSFQFI